MKDSETSTIKLNADGNITCKTQWAIDVYLEDRHKNNQLCYFITGHFNDEINCLFIQQYRVTFSRETVAHLVPTAH
jgi:hypothetical protein